MGKADTLFSLSSLSPRRRRRRRGPRPRAESEPLLPVPLGPDPLLSPGYGQGEQSFRCVGGGRRTSGLRGRRLLLRRLRRQLWFWLRFCFVVFVLMFMFMFVYDGFQ